MLQQGLYEQILYQLLSEELKNNVDHIVDTASIDEAEASKVISKYLAEIIEKGMDTLLDKGKDIHQQIELGNKIVSLIKQETDESGFEGMSIDQRAEQLLALIKIENSIYTIEDNRRIMRPETSIAMSSLFTGAVHEPSLYTEFKKEISSCDRIDMLVSFIKWSGLRLIIDELRTFTQNGGQLRVITTSYMGATDIKAIEELSVLPNIQLKVSYDTKRTRLHAKTYVFYRNSGFSTAYVGSSNLSNVAISSGLEWNVKVTAKDMPETMQKIMATFDSYWNSSDFESYSSEHRERLVSALKAEKYFDANSEQPYLFDIKPYPFQQEILDKLDAERKIRQQYRNLIVAATGTGKTVVSAFDYKRFRAENKTQACRLLYIVHREEILKQSISCFRGVLRDANFGELFVGYYRPEHIDYLFMSIQTFNSQDWTEKTSPDYYDYIVVDEFHHAAAPSYKKLLEYYQPKILLGLTATPERMDGLSVTKYFDERIAAEIRLPEAIERKLLSPFQYFGVTDIVDLSELTWARGGYDKTELSNVYTLNREVAKQRAHHVISTLLKYSTDMNDVIGLGFCVSIAHAEFMANYFNEHNIPSLHLTGLSPDEDRNTAKKRLVSGELRFLFVVDIYNEGVDIPEVNTVMFLRPTESLTIFLQQLGRGLRLAENKECLTVLDFIGQANKRYNFEEKFTALLDTTAKSVQSEIKNGFISVPKGCFIHLERIAKDYVLDNIRSSFNFAAGLRSRIKNFKDDSGKILTLTNFLDYYHLDPRTLYKRGSFSRLCVEAEIKDDYCEVIEEDLSKAFPRICAIDSRRWIRYLLNLLDQLENTDFSSLNSEESAMLRMFYHTIWQSSAEDLSNDDVWENLYALANSPVMLSELRELLQYNFNHIDFIDEKVNLGFDSPLDLHCTYTRDQLFLGLGFMKPTTVREGVKWLSDISCDIFLITLNKSSKDYSPTTMYEDYSINESLFHWQSQSTTSADSPTGLRYSQHGKGEHKVLLFVREFKNDIAGTAPYTFLGLAEYVKHDGSRPMNITYSLQRPIPAKYIKKTNKLLVG